MHTLSITLTPHWNSDTIAFVDFQASLPSQAIACEGPGLDYVDNAYGNIVPFPEYDRLSITDDLGPVPYKLDSAPGYTKMKNYPGFYFLRPPAGELKWSYRMYPRVLPEGYRSSPYYDFRAEPFGLNGSGMFSFILPKSEERFDVRFGWNMDYMPKEAAAYGLMEKVRRARR